MAKKRKKPTKKTETPKKFKKTRVKGTEEPEIILADGSVLDETPIEVPEVVEEQVDDHEIAAQRKVLYNMYGMVNPRRVDKLKALIKKRSIK